MEKETILTFALAEVKLVVSQARKEQCSIVLANDHGIYLMPDVFEKHDEYKGKIAICYASGCNPNLDADYYQKVRESMGHSYEEYRWSCDVKKFRNIFLQSNDLILFVSKTTIRFIE